MGEHWIHVARVSRRIQLIPVVTPLSAFHVVGGSRALQQRLGHGNSWEYRSAFEFIFMRETDNGPKNAAVGHTTSTCPRFNVQH